MRALRNIRALSACVSEQSGIALIESLVAVLLLAFGILGLLRMSATLVEANVQSRERIEAAFFAEQLIGMALADPTNAPCYAVNASLTCGSTTAATNVTAWATQVASVLPGITSTANKPSGTYATDGTFSVTVSWQKPSESESHSYTATTNVIN
jgi:type IV pilus assembly protein PilV